MGWASRRNQVAIDAKAGVIKPIIKLGRPPSRFDISMLVPFMVQCAKGKLSRRRTKLKSPDNSVGGLGQLAQAEPAEPPPPIVEQA